jgi:hypothetical protein
MKIRLNSGWKWTLLGAGVLLAGALIVIGAIWWGFEARFHQLPKAASYPAPQSRAEGVRQDLDYLAQLMVLDHSFSAVAKQAFEQARQQMMAQADTLSVGQLEMGISHAVALAGNGHTLVGRRSRRMARLPVRMVWFEEGLYVVRATEAHADLLGSRVLAINGVAPEALLPMITPYISGTAENARAASSLLFEFPPAMAGVWPEMSAEREKLSLRNVQGKVSEVELAGIVPDPKLTPLAFERNISPRRSPDEPEGWRALLQDGSALPLVLQEPDAAVLSRVLDGGKGLYVGIRRVEDDEKGSLSDQLERVLQGIAPGSLRYAILDMRFDGGGNYTKTLDFTKQLPKRVAADGKLIILTNNATFSAGIVTMARAKYFGGTRSTVMGERVGDREQFWAESAAPLVLPNSGIRVFYATGYHDWAVGCGEFSRCFWPNVLLDVPAGSLTPDVKMAWKFSDYVANRDTVFDAALVLARKGGGGGAPAAAAGAPSAAGAAPSAVAGAPSAVIPAKPAPAGFWRGAGIH